MADPLADCAIGFASKLPGGSQKQTELLDISKTVCESAAQLVYATKDAGGNPKAVHHHPAVDEAAEDLAEAIKDLTQQLEEAASDTGAVTALVNSINKARSAVRHFNKNKPFSFFCIVYFANKKKKTGKYVEEACQNKSIVRILKFFIQLI